MNLHHWPRDVVFVISDGRAGDRVFVVIAALGDGRAAMSVELADGRVVVIDGPPPKTRLALAALVDFARRAAAGDTSLRWCS